VAALARGSDAHTRAAKACARAGDPGAARALREAARTPRAAT
jgi:hypothetical protein